MSKKESQELHDLVKKHVAKSMSKDVGCKPCIAEDPKFDNYRKSLGRLTQWTTLDGKRFVASGSTKKRLPPGVYEIHQSAALGRYFEKISVRTEGLIRFPQTNSEKVLKQIDTFWSREELFNEYKLPHKRGILLWGPPGCLAAETLIKYESRSSSGKRRSHKTCSIERLYQIFNRITGSEKGRYQIHPKDSVYWVSSVDDDGLVFKNRVLNVVKSGVKECFLLKTSQGYTIEATEDHKFFLGDRYIPLKEIKLGDTVQIHDNKIVSSDQSDSLEPSEVNRKFLYLKYHPLARRKTVAGKYQYSVVPLARAVVEANMNQISLEEYKDKLDRKDIACMVFLKKSQDVHHIDENCANDVLENLMVIDHAEHARIHGLIDKSLRYSSFGDSVVSITSVGNKETYDLQMESPYHNFVASNFVTHNSGKTCTVNLIMNDVVIDRDGIVIKFGNPIVFREGMRELREIETDMPIVVLMEDIDAILEKNDESEVLNILDGVETLNKVIFLATTNYPERLGPRIVNRPSRFDKRFKIGYPDEESRFIYFKHLCGQKTPEELGIDIKKWVCDTHEFSIAHLKELFVAVIILGDNYEESLDDLKLMGNEISSEDDRTKKMGFALGDAHKQNYKMGCDPGHENTCS